MKELISIISELKAPKSQYNSFGKYKYRSCEDILESVKPLLAKYNVLLTITDDVVLVGDRIYIKSTASVVNSDGLVVTASSFAREEETKKGMDASQVSGAASSYARKYALNGLFCIDDTKDSDATNTHGQASSQPKQADLFTQAIKAINEAKTLDDVLAKKSEWEAKVPSEKKEEFINISRNRYRQIQDEAKSK